MRESITILGVVLVSLIVFHVKMGFQKVATDNDEWLLIRTTDRLPDYLTFRYFQRVNHEELPDTLNYSYPQRISPIYTNILPLISYPIKWLGLGGSERFQAFGYWFLGCFLLQGIFAVYFLRALNIKDSLSVFLGSCFFILSVPMLFRLDHPALLHHWTVIAGLIPFFTKWKNSFTMVWYVVLAIIASSTHPYMLPFGSGLPVFYGLHQRLRRGSFNIWDIAIPISSIAVSLMLLWSMGAFGFDVSTAAGGGFGYYSANLNTFYNNFGLTQAPLEFDTYHDGAYEGLAYLGLGCLLLCVANLFYHRNFKQKFISILSRKWIAITAGIMVFTFFAFSDVWTFHDMVLVSWPDNWGERYFGIFRSSGRYIWPLFYLLMGLIIYGWTRSPLQKRWIQVGLMVALLIQLWDVYPILTDKIPDDSRIDQFENKNWEQGFSQFDLIVTYPPFQRTLYDTDDASHMIYIASKEAKPISAGHLPRPDQSAQFAFQKELDQLLKGDSDNPLVKKYESALFITTVGYLPIFENAIANGYLETWQKGNYVLLANPAYVSKRENLTNFWATFDNNRVVHLSDWMEEHKQGHLVIVGQDESTSHPGPEFLKWMADRNSNFSEVAFRDAYFAWLENGNLRHENRNQMTITDTINIYGNQWIVHSEGNRGGNDSYLIVNDKRIGDLQRGLNIFHVEQGADSITFAHFDTYMTSVLQKEIKIPLTSPQN